MKVTERTRIGTMGCLFLALLFSTAGVDARQEGAVPSSRYMGGPVALTKAPNGAIVNTETLQASSRILYLEPATEKVTEGVWCIGGYSLANTTVIEGEDGLIVYDTGDTREVARVWALFDKFNPARNYKVPPLED